MSGHRPWTSLDRERGEEGPRVEPFVRRFLPGRRPEVSTPLTPELHFTLGVCPFFRSFSSVRPFRCVDGSRVVVFWGFTSCLGGDSYAGLGRDPWPTTDSTETPRSGGQGLCLQTT